MGDNPKKLGRPSHSYHSALMANTRLALAVDVLPGNETAPMHSMPGIWAWLDVLPKAARPAPPCCVVTWPMGASRCCARPRPATNRT